MVKWYLRHRGLLNYIIRRLGIAVLLAFGITIITFLLANLVPNDPVVAALGEVAASKPDLVAAFRAQYGLDKPLYVQYWIYLTNLLHGDLGTSYITRHAVAEDLSTNFPATLELALFTIVSAAVIGLFFGVLAAYRKGKASDQVLRVVSLVGISVPSFWLAILSLYLFYFRLRWTPGSGRLSPGAPPPKRITGLYTVDALVTGDFETFVDAAGHLILPVFVLTLYAVGLLTRFTRTTVLEVLDKDYVHAATAKGLPLRTVLFKYVLRGAMIPILTIIGVVFGGLLSGTVLIESIFSRPGLGSYAFRAAMSLDLVAVMGTGLVIGLIFIMTNFLVDLAYGLIDPRVRVGQR
ncbi:MAG: ABC transporter permease [Bifidobacteriaceae bacterium]|jgi:peptide/nickel transport system permease protein|nr:ABC transporter permease [Bifidobacteriaceae bacterium]